MQKTSISPIDVCVTNYKSRKSREKVDLSIVCYCHLEPFTIVNYIFHCPKVPLGTTVNKMPGNFA